MLQTLVKRNMSRLVVQYMSRDFVFYCIRVVLVLRLMFFEFEGIPLKKKHFFIKPESFFYLFVQLLDLMNSEKSLQGLYI